MKILNYKKHVFLLILYVFNIINISLNAKELPNQNNKFELYNKSSAYEYYLYIFTNYNSCSSCTKDLNTILSNLNVNKKSRITLFLSGAKNSVIEEYQAKYKDALEIVADPLGLYFREYKIEANNTYIFLDSKGVQLDNGDIYNLQSNTIETFINNKDSTKLELLEIKTIKFAKNNSPITANRYAKGLYSKKNNKYYIADTKGFRLNIFDSTGALINYIMFPHFNKYYNITCQQISWLEDDKTIFLHLSGDKTPDFTFSNTYLRCDIDNNTLTDIKLPDLDSIRTQLLVYTSPYINAYVAVSNFSKEMKDQDLHNIKPLSYFDSNCVMKLNFGRVMDVYYQYDLRLAYMELLTFSNQYIFSLQAYSNKIQKFNLKGDFVRELTFDFANSFRKVNTGLPINATRAEWTKFIRNCSMIRSFNYDVKSNYFLTVMRNDEIPDNVEDPMSPLCKRNYFLNIFNDEGKLLSNDILLKEDFPLIMYFNDKTIGILHTTDNQLQVTWYKVNL